jgi:hypothetical protein
MAMKFYIVVVVVSAVVVVGPVVVEPAAVEPVPAVVVVGTSWQVPDMQV